MEFFSPVFLSPLEFLKAVFLALCFFCFSSMISPTLWKIFLISFLMPPPSAIPSVIPQIGKQQPLHCLQIWIKSQADQTHKTCLSILTNVTLSLCLSERTVWNPHHPIYVLNNPLKKSFNSSFWVSLSAMIFLGKATFPNWPPKPVANWASSIVQSPSLAHLISKPHTKLLSAA